MTLAGNEIVRVVGLLSNGQESGCEFQTTTGAIAALGGGGGGGPSSAVEYPIAATGSAITVSAGDTWLNLTQSGTIASQAVNLPTSPSAGQLFYCSTKGQVTALTLSPTAQGWTNGSTMGAAQGFLLIYSGNTSTWTRIS